MSAVICPCCKKELTPAAIERMRAKLSLLEHTLTLFETVGQVGLDDKLVAHLREHAKQARDLLAAHDAEAAAAVKAGLS